MLTQLKQTIEPNIPLGQKSLYPKHYDKSLLFSISRAKQRAAMGLPAHLVSLGYDVWNAYELYWLNENGKPIRGYASFVVKADSPNLLESKSVKLYLHSLNHQRFSSADQVATVIGDDLSDLLGERTVSISLRIH